ncbi:acetyl-CoA carboxylase biotin carboxyl carrier protein [Acidaminobacter hydrogenoformans]|uniref:Biotin carboxyl carrier protein of acetyl-CoA carboxylase n=1 Tax=Acidaminobacter hydrogenoformans DSM 2784 TaxID=1120920 RepID=A0A1G5RXA3_9FIRM|nr:acetyl-CoA carboxylase biotin carboxyl carrier protein [Acidaminobacter hydrogenoformans]SCZ78636.1 acetyl-CoA carboxylase biotin carboxyl carrier protein [Acidaminobacter hydrogenoformans DSM 2784]
METREIEILLQAFNATDLTRMAYSKEGFSLVLERQSDKPVFAETHGISQPSISAPASLPVAALNSAPVPAPAPGAATTAAPTAPAASPEDLIKAPLVGVFYNAPAPDAAPFVTSGQTVKKGQTLCIIEAMKVMNEIQAEWDGVVDQILARPEDIVEYGQPLFSIRRLG